MISRSNHVHPLPYLHAAIMRADDDGADACSCHSTTLFTLVSTTGPQCATRSCTDTHRHQFHLWNASLCFSNALIAPPGLIIPATALPLLSSVNHMARASRLQQFFVPIELDGVKKFQCKACGCAFSRAYAYRHSREESPHVCQRLFQSGALSQQHLGQLMYDDCFDIARALDSIEDTCSSSERDPR